MGDDKAGTTGGDDENPESPDVNGEEGSSQDQFSDSANGTEEASDSPETVRGSGSETDEGGHRQSSDSTIRFSDNTSEDASDVSGTEESEETRYGPSDRFHGDGNRTGSPESATGADTSRGETGSTERPPHASESSTIESRTSAGEATTRDSGWGSLRSVFLGTEEGWKQFAREIVVSVLIVASIGLLLFAISGVWPPMVAVESGSMEPHLSRGDLVFVMEEHRFSPEFAVEGTGVVTTRIGARHGYRRFGAPGDVIVYQPYGNEHRTPVIHRARFWVEQGENWYDTADPRYMSADSCEELAYCPAPYSGFITKGDNNGYYDQVRGISNPVKPEWIRGTAVFKIPWLGWVRLAVSEATVLPLRPVDITPIALDGGTPTGTGYQPQSGS